MGGTRLLRAAVKAGTAIFSTFLVGCAPTISMIAETQDGQILNPATVQTSYKTKRFNFLNPRSPSAADELRGSPTATCDTDMQTFLCSQERSKAAAGDPTLASLYLNNGITLSNELCDDWFKSLYVTQVTFHQTSDFISSTGSLTSAILGFSRAASKDIGLTASVFGFGKQAADSMAANYVVATDLITVAAAVRDYRSQYAAQIDNQKPDWNYYTARRAIMAYDNTCSALSVRRLVNNRVSGVPAEQETTALYEQTLANFIVEWKSRFTKPMTASNLVDLYTYLYSANLPTDVQDELKTRLVTNKFVDESKIFSPGDSMASLSQAITRSNLRGYLDSLASARIEAIEAQLKAKAISEPSRAPSNYIEKLPDEGTSPQAETKSIYKTITSEPSPPLVGMPTTVSGRPLDQPPRP